MKHPILLLVLTAWALASCSHQPPAVYSFSRPLMHTRWDFSLVARSQEEAERGLNAAVTEIERLDQMLAMWKPESAVAAFNAKAGEGSTQVPPELDELIRVALGVAEKSEGAFDVTIGPLVQLWYYKLKEEQVPTAADIAAARARMDWRELKEGPGKAAWSLPKGFNLDLGGVAKGYAQDKAALLLKKYGIRQFMLNAGGQVYALGRKPDGTKWRIGVIHPRSTERLIAVMELEDQGMSTSGDYEQSTFIRGVRYHHILDVRTGYPTANGSASATVVVDLKAGPLQGAFADCLSTAAFVLGPEKAVRFLEGLHVSGLLVKETNGRLDALLTDDLKGKLSVSLGGI